MIQMIIEKVDDGKKFPRCPDCGVPLYQESEELTRKQEAQKEKWSNCDHEFDRRVCVKCGYSVGIYHSPMARLMRCPKCAALYHVEGDQ